MVKENIINHISEELEIKPIQVRNTINLFEEKATIHFIARYRKDLTKGLDEEKIRLIEEKYNYYSELEKRKETIIKVIKEQGKLTDDLHNKILSCRQKQFLEDIYLPFKPKKRTKATIAQEKGLMPLAEMILSQKNFTETLDIIVGRFINEEKKVKSLADALNGAMDIVAEKISENAQIRKILRSFTYSHGILKATVLKKHAQTKTKFSAYYNFSESLKKTLSHRILAIKRGTKEKILSWSIVVDQDKAINLIKDKIIKNKNATLIDELIDAIKDSYTRLLQPSIESEVFAQKFIEAQNQAIEVFSKNLKNLLLTPAAGHKIIMGIDPGYKAGCKIAVIDKNGNFLEFDTIYPHPPQLKEDNAKKNILALIKKYNVELIAVGNGTASKETFILVDSIIETAQLKCKILIVNEAGASVYSTSKVAMKEFPDLDIMAKGAISIARRLQDPLSELVKIDPKSIGVGQYQHDVNQSDLKKSLTFVVESCVNNVGVDLNTASEQLLSYVSGINSVVAKNIVEYRKDTGSYQTKKELLKVKGLGESTFEQCAGFLRILNGKNILDNSAIHPENYLLIETIAKDYNTTIEELIGNKNIIDKINFKKYINEKIGFLTLDDIRSELKKPGVDPRDEFTTIEYDKTIKDINDIKPELVLSGTVSNVTNFGAFVDIGIHNDGLIHISQLSEKYVKNPHDIVSVGDRVKVVVISVDYDLKRIALKLLNK